MSLLQSWYGVLGGLGLPLQILLLLAVAVGLGFCGSRLWVWVVAGTVLGWALGLPLWLGVPLLGLAAVFLLPPLRRILLTRHLMAFMKARGFLPVISRTEQEAIDAGTVWVDAELFSGAPDFRRITAMRRRSRF